MMDLGRKMLTIEVLDVLWRGLADVALGGALLDPRMAARGAWRTAMLLPAALCLVAADRLAERWQGGKKP